MFHLQVGARNRVAFVLSCPGRYELLENRPAAGTTGTNLEGLLLLLGQQLDRNDLTRPMITITNSWSNIEYTELTGRPEPTPQQVIHADNLQRLGRELSGITEFAVFCGTRAEAVSRQLNLPHNPTFVRVCHLGLRAMNASIRTDIIGNEIIRAGVQIAQGSTASKKSLESENTQKRIAVIAKSVVDQLCRN